MSHSLLLDSSDFIDSKDKLASIDLTEEHITSLAGIVNGPSSVSLIYSQSVIQEKAQTDRPLKPLAFKLPVIRKKAQTNYHASKSIKKSTSESARPVAKSTHKPALLEFGVLLETERIHSFRKKNNMEKCIQVLAIKKQKPRLGSVVKTVKPLTSRRPEGYCKMPEAFAILQSNKISIR